MNIVFVLFWLYKISFDWNNARMVAGKAQDNFWETSEEIFDLFGFGALDDPFGV